MKNQLLYHLLIALFFLHHREAIAQTNLPEIPKVNTHLILASGTNGAPALTAGDRFGNGISRIGDLDNDGIEDMVIGAPLDNDGGTDRGAVYICFMRNDKTIRTYNKISSSDMGTDLANQDYFGWSVAGIGDLNNDGKEDIAVGTLNDDDGGTNRGAVYIIFLDTLGGIIDKKKLSDGTNGFPAEKLSDGSKMGSAVALIGDIDGDNINDIAIGANNKAIEGISYGAVYVALMNSNGTADTVMRIAEGENGFSGDLDLNDNFGNCISGAGDMNNDNIPDMIVGVPGDDDGFTDSGGMYILYMQNNGTVKSTKKLSQPFLNKYFAYSTVLDFPRGITVMDINQDGQQDIVAGAPTTSSAGYIFVLTLDTTENVTAVRRYGEFSSRTYGFPTSAYRFGMAVSSISDMGNDGKPEILVNAADHVQGASAEGAVIVLSFDSLTYQVDEGTVHHFIKYGDYSGNFTGAMTNYDSWATSIVKVGDVNRDGINDIAVGEWGDDDGGTGSGAVWIMFMDSVGFVSSQQKISRTSGNLGTGIDNIDGFGVALAAPGDIDGDTIPDLVVGSFQDDDGGGNNGAIWILYLNSNGTVKSKTKISETSGGFTGDISTGGEFGIAVASIGDVDKDGVNDLAVGERRCDDGGKDRGALWILLMNSNETVKTQQKISDTNGDFTATFANSNLFGTSVCYTGDFDGDTIQDVTVGALSTDGTGAVFILYLGTDGKVDGYKKINYAAGNFPVALESGGYFGSPVGYINDLDGNGKKELIIGNIQAKSYTQTKGSFWITYLDSTGNVIKAKKIDEENGRLYASLNANDYFGAGFDFYGVNKDGLPVILVGSSASDEGGTDRGAAYMIALGVALDKYPKYNHDYAKLYRTIDGAYYFLSPNKKLRFRYDGEYVTGKLEWKIYDWLHNVDFSSSITPTKYKNAYNNNTTDAGIGENLFEIDLSCAGYGGMTAGYYTLEVTNEKNEKWYLRFYTLGNYGCPFSTVAVPK